MEAIKFILFWSIMIVPVVVLMIIFPMLLIPYIVAGGLAAFMYAMDFGDEKEFSGILSAFLLPHLYFLIKIVFSDGGIL